MLSPANARKRSKALSGVCSVSGDPPCVVCGILTEDVPVRAPFFAAGGENGSGLQFPLYFTTIA
jgi:hypothetical protein